MNKSSVCFDFDSTLVTIEGIDVLAEFLGRSTKDITDRAMEGRITLEEAYKQRLELLQIKPQQLFWLSQIYTSNLVPGASELIKVLQYLGHRVLIVSGGFLRAIHPVAQILGITEVHAVDLDFSEGYGKIPMDSPFLRADGKSRILMDLTLEQSIFVGDGITDLATREVCSQMIPYFGVVKRSFVADCDLMSYGGKNLLGLLPVLIGEEGYKQAAYRFPEELKTGADEFLQEGNVLHSREDYSWISRYRSQIFLVPGPTQTNKEIAELRFAPITHRSTEFQTLYADLQIRLGRYLGWDGDFLFSASSATGMMEAVLANLEPALVLSCQSGDFGERWQTVAEALGHQVDVVRAKEGCGMNPYECLDALGKHQVVLLTASETANGTYTDVNLVALELKKKNPQILVFADLVSAAAGADISTDGLDAIVFGTQKCLSLPTGLGILWCSTRLKEMLETSSIGRGYYLNLKLYLKYHRENSVPHTPAITILQSLRAQLLWFEKQEFDFIRHHQKLARLTRDFCLGMGWEIFAKPGHQSPTVTAVKIPENITDIRLRARNAGVFLASGYGKLKDSHFRIGHMGILSESDLKKAFEILGGF
ncbi:MAG: aminotransferase class V-fold PLP-dependent enzyme [Candidatus Cloacimonetes bacterium]|nr:aminotransferase class V-fold PLP-dependent enzyme [Candidatus Cloacimonadota bacterium]